MKKLNWLLLVVLLAFGCQNDDELLEEKATTESIVIKSGDVSNARLTDTGVNCGATMSFPLLANGSEVGSVTVTVDSTKVTITYDISSEWFLFDVSTFAGNCDSIPDSSGYPYFESFSLDDEVRSYTLEIALTELPECGCISAVATVARFNSSSALETFTTSAGTDYCDCSDDGGEPEPDPADSLNLRTQTPGGWGAPPNGNNPGAYLHANFDSAFPDGLVVGCDYTMTFSSAQAITDYLPHGGKPAALTQSYLDPVNQPKNTLASHVIALKLSVAFDGWDEDFGESATNLGNSVIASGDFAGWTVAQALAEGEKILGGCASDYTASQITSVLTGINENYVDGTTNKGFLINSN